MLDFIFEETVIQTCAKILISAAFGIVLGIERKKHSQAIGIRTLLLISVSCSLMGVLSFSATNMHLMGDPTRIAAGVLTGIGFIGGGAILHQGFNIKGITTAAIIWITAALGLAVGFGMLVPAFFAFFIAFFGLLFFQKIEDKFFPASKVKNVSLFYKGGKPDVERIKEILKENKMIVRDMNFSNNYQDDLLNITILVNAPDTNDFEKISSQLKQTGNLQNFIFSN